MGPGESIGAVMQRRYRVPRFIHADFPSFSVWDYVPSNVLMCRRRGGITCVGSCREDVDHENPSPRDPQSKHVHKSNHK